MATKKKPAAKPAKKATPAKPAKKSAPAKKVAPAKKAKPAPKKAAPAKKAPVKKAPAKKVTTAKKGSVTKKTDIKKSKELKKTSNKKTVPAKAAPAKKATAKKAAPAKKEAPKKAAPVKKEAPKKVVAPAKAAPAKAAPAKPAAKEPVKAAPAPVKSAKSTKASSKPAVTKTVTTFAKGAIPGRPGSGMSSGKPTPTRTVTREEKKPTVIVAHRRLENKAKEKDKEGKTMISYQPEFTRSILDEPEMQQGPVYRYSDEELNEFRELINVRMENARKELGYLQGLITRKDEAGTEDTENRYMNMEDGSGAMEREQLAQLASRQIQFINHLEKALMRIENKTYGICRVTGKLIDKARLRAVPHATLSIEAKKYMSNK